MASGGNSRPGGSVVSVADLIARDAPWSGAPEAVDVTGRPVSGIPAQRASSRSDGRPAARAGGDPMRRFLAAAWSPNWRFITICACVLVAGLLSNVVLLATMSGPDDDSRAAGSEEGGYPAGDPLAEPPELSVQPPSATLPGLGLPLALASLGSNVPSSGSARTAPAAASALVGAPARGGGWVIASGGTGSSARGSTGVRANDGSLGGTVAGVGKVADGTVTGLGNTLDGTLEGVGGVVGGPAGSTVTGLGKTTRQLTDTVGGPVSGLTNGVGELLGGQRKASSRDSDGDSGDSDSSSRSDNGGGGLLGGLLGGGR